MCVLAFAWRAHPRWTLVLAGNRDELHARPALPLARWDEPGHLPFNLIVADRERASFLSNRPEILRSVLAPGIYGLSNGALDEPWPKTLRVKELLLEWIMGGASQLSDLLEGLREDTLPGFGFGPAVPSDVPQEPAVSPIFIRGPVYGTRCSTLVGIDDRGQGKIVERRYDSAGDGTGETALSFSWPG